MIQYSKIPLRGGWFMLSMVIIVPAILAILLTCGSETKGNDKMPAKKKQQSVSWKEKAEKMVESQIISRGIRDENVLRVMKITPRHRFVPGHLEENAYNDHPLPIGSGQTISQPYIVALMTELLELRGTEKVLEIGTGSGYQAAILSQLVDSCYSIELVKVLAEKSASILKELGYNNILVRWGDGYKGWPEKAPFDRIIITAAPEEIPEALLDQLAVGGKMVLPIGGLQQDLISITRNKDGIQKENIIPVRFVPMVHPPDSDSDTP